jgi:hypothetical protein
VHRHNVFFNFKPELSPAQIDEAVSKLQSLERLPTVQKMVVAKSITPRGERSPWEWALMGDFADQEARAAYEADEYHKEVVRGAFLPNVSDFIFLDVNW